MKDNRFMSTKIKILYLFLAIMVIYTLWPSSTDDEEQAFVQTSLIDSDAQGEPRVFGIQLGKTTLAEAETILGSRSKRALFIMPPEKDEHGEPLPAESNIEAFFPNMPDNSKMLLGLHTEKEQLDLISHKAHKPIAFPSGNIKMEIADEHMVMVNQMTVITLTAIPRINLSPKDIQSKFGEPAMVHVQDEVIHILYPEIGLDAILDKSGEAMLQFTAKDKFFLALENIGLTEQDLLNAQQQNNKSE